MFDFISDIANDVVEAVDGAWDSIGDAVSYGVDLLSDGFADGYEAFSSGLGELGGGVANAAGDAYDASLGQLFESVNPGDVSDTVQDIGKFAGDAANYAMDKGKGLMDFIKDMDSDTKRLLGGAATAYYLDRKQRRELKNQLQQIEKQKTFHGTAYI